ncbi:MAG: 2-isopropylmalate synthase [Planctomycetota bacterium]
MTTEPDHPDQPDRSADWVRIFDTTLRDGEQSPGATLTFEEKIQIARTLENMGVDVIEAGFPISSDGDFASVRAIAEQCQTATICGLARSVPGDIDRAGEAIAPAAHGRIHVFCATSKIHREHKLRKGTDDILALVEKSVKQALGFTNDVEFSPEDTTRTEFDFLRDVVKVAIDAGATTINLPDTTGYSYPAEYATIFRQIREALPVIDERGIILSTHCHNDLGMAVANSLAAVEAGARQVECTINGIGERAGNAALEEVVMALRTRADHFGIDTRIQGKRIYHASRQVSMYTGLDVQRNKAIVGQNAFDHESGIHQDGVLKHRETYEIMNPADVGVPTSALVLGKHSGRAAFRDRLHAFGITLTDAQTETAFTAFKKLADKKKEVYDEDIEAIVDDVLETDAGAGRWVMTRMQVTAGSDSVTPTATVTMQTPEGEMIRDAAIGDGPVDAIYSAIMRIVDHTFVLNDYRIRAVTGGKDAQGEVHVELRDTQANTAGGRGLSTDILEASAFAYVAAVNRLLNPQRREVTQMSGV